MPPSSAPTPGDTIAAILADPRFQAATAVLEREHDRTVEDIVTLTEIPAPPFAEEARAAAYLAMLRDAWARGGGAGRGRQRDGPPPRHRQRRRPSSSPPISTPSSPPAPT